MMRKLLSRNSAVALFLSLATLPAFAVSANDPQGTEPPARDQSTSATASKSNTKGAADGPVRIQLPDKSVMSQSPGTTAQAERALTTSTANEPARSAPGKGMSAVAPLTFSLSCKRDRKASDAASDLFPERIEIRNVGTRMVPSGTRITWPVMDSTKLGEFSLERDLAPGRTLTLKRMLQPVPTGVSCAVLVR